MTRRKKPLHPDEIVACLNKAVQLPNASGDNAGVYMDIDTWRKLDGLVDLIPLPPSPEVPQRPDPPWTYRLSEAELGMVALMAYQKENTAQSFEDRHKPIRLIGRFPGPLHRAVEAYFDMRRAPSRYGGNKDRFAGIHSFNETRYGVAYTIENGAEIVRIAKEFYST